MTYNSNKLQFILTDPHNGTDTKLLCCYILFSFYKSATKLMSQFSGFKENNVAKSVPAENCKVTVA